MPMIRLTTPAGALTEQGRRGVQRDLAAVLLRWEGAPDTAFFRAQAWSYLVELPDGAQTTAEDDAPRFLVEVTVPRGALSERRKAGLVEEATKTVLAAAGLAPDDALRVWVLVHEQPDGTWGAGGSVIRYADLVALAQQGKGDQGKGDKTDA
ncbi:4-oxalocrotonate tautomerase family protein [Streptomyces sp. NPDC057623]|uniref:tautomerase family protein n=1 Tax=Streptomyces sp. NPDC057623 TaxID=3346187 RepID=UPI003679263A